MSGRADGTPGHRTTDGGAEHPVAGHAAGWRLLREPYLDVDVVEPGPAGTIELRRGEVRLAIDAGDADGAAGLAGLLAGLRSAGSAAWTEAAEGAGLDPLLVALDRSGLIADAAPGQPAAAAAAAERERCVRELAGWLTEAVAVAGAPLRELLAGWAEPGGPAVAGPAARRPAAGVLASALDRMAAYWRRYVPDCLELTAGAAAAALGRPPAGLATDAGAGLGDPLTSVGELRGELDAWAGLVVLAAVADRPLPPVEPPPAAVSGSALAIAVERLAADHARGRRNRFADVLADRPSRRLAVGAYVEQFHLSRRYVEAICPLLSRRLAAPLRAAMFRYYAEEVGHESYEARTCRALGLAGADLAASLALPPWVGYVDVLVALAADEPLGFLACVLVAEGLPGAPPRVKDMLAGAGLIDGAAEVAAAHEELNVELDHSYLQRRLLGLVPAVTPARAAAALRAVVLLLELNGDAWDMAAWFYGSRAGTLEPAAPVHRWLALAPADLLDYARWAAAGR